MSYESDVADEMVRSAYGRRVSQVESVIDVEATLQAVHRRGSGRLRRGARLTVLGSRRPLVPLIAGFSLAFVLIGTVGLLGVAFDRKDGPAGVESAPGTVATQPTVTTSPASEDTGIDDWTNGAYRVVPAVGTTTIPVWNAPSPTASAAGSVSGGDGVVLTGEAATVEGVTYYHVAAGDGEGWIEASHVSPPEAWLTGFDRLDCEPDGAAFETEQAVMPASIGPHRGPAAGHVLDVLYHRSEECERLVVVLGSGAGTDQDGRWLGDPAAWVPEGTEVRSGTSVVSVRVPGVAEVRPVASTLVFGNVLGLASRSVDGAVLDFIFDGNRRAAVQILENPARVVIDLRPSPTGSGVDLAPRLGSAFVVMPIQADVDGPGLALPVTVAGWGRPHEATAVAELRSAATTPGAGVPVEALFETESTGPERTWRYVFSTADWVLWSPFSFTIDDVPPGDYELFVAENTAPETAQGVYLRFSVAG